MSGVFCQEILLHSRIKYDINYIRVHNNVTKPVRAGLCKAPARTGFCSML